MSEAEKRVPTYGNLHTAKSLIDIVLRRRGTSLSTTILPGYWNLDRIETKADATFFNHSYQAGGPLVSLNLHSSLVAFAGTLGGLASRNLRQLRITDAPFSKNVTIVKRNDTA